MLQIKIERNKSYTSCNLIIIIIGILFHSIKFDVNFLNKAVHTLNEFRYNCPLNTDRILSVITE